MPVSGLGKENAFFTLLQLSRTRPCFISAKKKRQIIPADRPAQNGLTITMMTITTISRVGISLIMRKYFSARLLLPSRN